MQKNKPEKHRYFTMKKTKNVSYFKSVTQLICGQNGHIRLLNNPIENCHAFDEILKLTSNGRNDFEMCHLISVEILNNGIFNILMLINCKNKFTSKAFLTNSPTNLPCLLWSRIHALETDIGNQLSLFPEDLPVSPPIKRRKRVKK